MATNIPFFRGKDVILKVFQDNGPIYLAAKNWSVEENALEAADGVNGESRDRLDKVTNFYSASVDVFQSDVEVLNKIIEAQKPDDASALPLEQHGAIIIRMRDGTRACYLLKEMKLGPFSMNQSGRAEAVMVNLKMRFRFFESAATA